MENIKKYAWRLLFNLVVYVILSSAFQVTAQGPIVNGAVDEGNPFEIPNDSVEDDLRFLEEEYSNPQSFGDPFLQSKRMHSLLFRALYPHHKYPKIKSDSAKLPAVVIVSSDEPGSTEIPCVQSQKRAPLKPCHRKTKQQQMLNNPKLSPGTRKLLWTSPTSQNLVAAEVYSDKSDTSVDLPNPPNDMKATVQEDKNSDKEDLMLDSNMSFNKRGGNDEDNLVENSLLHFGKRMDHNVMHFGKRPDDSDHNIMMHFGKRGSSRMDNDKKRAVPDHNVMHFGKRADAYDHNVMHFGKRSEGEGFGHDVMHFGKRFGDSMDHGVLHFGKRPDDTENLNPELSEERVNYSDIDGFDDVVHFQKRAAGMEPSHDVMHFGKRFDPDHNVMHFGKRFDPDHNVMHFGKRFDPDHNVMHFGKRFDSDHNVMHFGKRFDPDHNVMHFGKRFNPDHNVMHFGKKFDPDHNVMHFGKRFDSDHNVMHFGKRFNPDHNVMHFGKRFDPDHNVMHFGKKFDPDHNVMHFGKRFDPDHNVMHFGKRFDPDHNVMHFGKRFDPDHNVMHFGKRFDPDHNVMHFGKRFDPDHNVMHFGKRYPDEEVIEENIFKDILKRNSSSTPLLSDVDSENNDVPFEPKLDESDEFDPNLLLDEELSEVIPNKELVDEDELDLTNDIFPSSNSKYDVHRILDEFALNPDKRRRWTNAPFEGAKSIVLPHAWLAAHIHKSFIPRRFAAQDIPFLGTKVAEKKELPANLFMHFG